MIINSFSTLAAVISPLKKPSVQPGPKDTANASLISFGKAVEEEPIPFYEIYRKPIFQNENPDHPIIPEKILRFNENTAKMQQAFDQAFFDEGMSTAERRNVYSAQIEHLLNDLSYSPQELQVDINLTPNGPKVDKQYGSRSGVSHSNLTRLSKKEGVDVNIHCHTIDNTFSAGDLGASASRKNKMAILSSPKYNYYIWPKEDERFSHENTQWFYIPYKEDVSRALDKHKCSPEEYPFDAFARDIELSLIRNAQRNGFTYVRTDKDGSIMQSSDEVAYPCTSKFDMPMERLVPDDYQPEKVEKTDYEKIIASQQATSPAPLKPVGETVSTEGSEYSIFSHVKVVNPEKTVVLKQAGVSTTQTKRGTYVDIILHDGSTASSFASGHIDRDNRFRISEFCFFEELKNTHEPLVLVDQLITFAKEKGVKEILVDLTEDDTLSIDVLKQKGFEASHQSPWAFVYPLS